jgi:hypothetical protein
MLEPLENILDSGKSRSYLVGTTGFDPLAEQGASLILVSKSGSEFRVGRWSLPLHSRKTTL